MSSNTRIVGSRDILSLCTKSKDLTVSNATAYTRSNTIVTLLGVIKPTSRLTFHVLKPNMVNSALTYLNAWTAKKNIKPTPTHTPSEDTASIENSTPRSTKNSVISGTNQFT